MAGTSPKRMTSTGRCIREAHRPLPQVVRLGTAVTVSLLMILLVEMPSGN